MAVSNAKPVETPAPGFELCYECDGTRVCIYCRGNGVLVDGRRCSTCGGTGWCIVCNGTGELTEGAKRAAEDASFRPEKRETLAVSREDAVSHGLPPITIRVDAAKAGMYTRLFPAKDTYLALNGPPGASLVIVVWNCAGCSGNLESVIRDKLVPTWTRVLDVGAPDRAELLGIVREGLTFATGQDRARISWFGFVLPRPEGEVLVAAGVSAYGEPILPAADIFENVAIRSAFSTFTID